MYSLEKIICNFSRSSAISLQHNWNGTKLLSPEGPEGPNGLLNTLREKCPSSGLFWSAFSRISTEYGEILRIPPYSVQMRKYTDQNKT